MSSGSDDWCTIESDPGVFTQLLEELGCTTVELEELWSMDDESLMKLQHEDVCYGLIFLFKWMGKEEGNGDTPNPNAKQGEEEAKEPLSEVPENLFFAHQVTTNACATQAILSVLFNAKLEQDQLGKTLTEFKSFTATFPPNLKGVAIGSSEEIKKVHNSFSRKDLGVLSDGKARVATKDDDVFHFVAYVPVDGTVYELDGLQRGPIVIGEYKSDDWLVVARKAIQQRMDAYSPEMIKFNLMAVVRDKRISIKQRLEQEMENSDLVAALAVQDAKRDAWKAENERRRHNYVPFCIELLKGLAQTGQLSDLIGQAKERQATKLKKMTDAKTSA